MSSKYKVGDDSIAHFVTFTVVGWIDVFSRETACVGTGITMVIATIIEDFLTLGVGAADDPASFALAYRIIRFGIAL